MPKLIEWPDPIPGFESPGDGDPLKAVLKAAGRRSLFGKTYVGLGNDFHIVVERAWTDPLQDVTDQISLSLVYTGKSNHHNMAILHMACDGMFTVMAAAAKMIEDQKKLTWHAPSRMWTF